MKVGLAALILSTGVCYNSRQAESQGYVQSQLYLQQQMMQQQMMQQQRMQQQYRQLQQSRNTLEKSNLGRPNIEVNSDISKTRVNSNIYRKAQEVPSRYHQSEEVKDTRMVSDTTETRTPPAPKRLDCPENLPLEQLVSYNSLEKRLPITRYSNKEGCAGTIIYNSAEGRIIYYTSSDNASKPSRVTDLKGKTIWDCSKISTGTGKAAGACSLPLKQYLQNQQSFGCAGQRTISKEVAIGSGAGTLFVITPLVYLGIRNYRRRRKK